MKSKEMNIDEEYRRAIGDIILWNIPVIKDKNGWPERKKYSFMQLFKDPEYRIETKNNCTRILGIKGQQRDGAIFYTWRIETNSPLRGRDMDRPHT